MARRFRKQRAWAGRAYGNRRSYAKKAGGILGMNMGTVAGLIIGLTDYDKMIPLDVKVGLAVVPGKIVPYQIKQLMGGMLLGDIIQARTGFTLGGAGSGSSSTGSW